MFNLLRPWSYLLIRPATSEMRVVNYYLPLLFAVSVVLVTYYIDSDGTNIFVSDAALIKIGAFVQTLPGFYVAALSAIATFQKPDLDSYLLGKEFYIKDHQGNTIRLTRRRFLCIMFAYLTAQSIAFSLVCILMNSINYAVFCFFNIKMLPFIVAGFIYFILFQFLLITLWSIFYLGEKIHIPNPKS